VGAALKGDQDLVRYSLANSTGQRNTF